MNAHAPIRDVTDSGLSLDDLAHEIATRAKKADGHRSPPLCVFANFAGGSRRAKLAKMLRGADGC